MIVQIKSVQFDFESDGEIPSAEQQQEVIGKVIGKVYTVEDEDSIADAISDDTGWLVSSLDYEVLDEPQEYDMYVDIEHKIWYRMHFTVTAINEHHADRLAKDVFKRGGWDALNTKFGTDDWETLDDTAEETGVQQLFRDDTLISEIGD